MALAATSRTEKRARVLHVIAAHPTASNREIGRLAGVDHKTVAALRRSGGETEIPHSGGIKASRQIPRSPMNGEISQPKTPQGGRLKIPHSNNLSRGGEIRDPAAWLATAPTEEIAHRIPPERWLDLGWKLTRPEGFGALSCEFPHIADLDEWLAQAPLETIAARVPAERRDNLGWNLVRLAALPKPKKKKPGKSVPGVNWRRKTTDEQRRDVIRLRALGVQYKEITRLTKVNRGTAQSIVKLGR